jgi:hypothetical protein
MKTSLIIGAALCVISTGAFAGNKPLCQSHMFDWYGHCLTNIGGGGGLVANISNPAHSTHGTRSTGGGDPPSSGGGDPPSNGGGDPPGDGGTPPGNGGGDPPGDGGTPPGGGDPPGKDNCDHKGGTRAMETTARVTA